MKADLALLNFDRKTALDLAKEALSKETPMKKEGEKEIKHVKPVKGSLLDRL